jgi:hypothetical protein
MDFLFRSIFVRINKKKALTKTKPTNFETQIMVLNNKCDITANKNI